MKNRVLVLLMILAKFSIGQDLSDEVYFKKLKGISCSAYNKADLKYSTVLKSCDVLLADYNLIPAGEKNVSYTFIFTPKSIYFENNCQKNEEFINSKLAFMMETLSIDVKKHKTEYIKAISAELCKNSGSGNAIIQTPFITGYDEAYVAITNTSDLFTVEFFFRNLF